MAGADRNDNWLTERVSVEEAEATFTPSADDLASHPKLPNKPFAFKNQEWEIMKSHMLDGDELWYFCSPTESWRALAGRAGIALVRNGAVVERLVLRMN